LARDQEMAVKALVWIVLVAALLFAGLRWLERASLYIPSRTHYAHPGSYGIPYEDVWLSAADGVRLHAWYASAEDQPVLRGADDPPLPEMRKVDGGPVVVFFHGNGGNVSHRIQKLRYFLRMGASVLLFDYRGYGLSGGSPDEEGTYRDGRAAVAEALARAGGDRSRLVYYGESLGCAIALQTALETPPRALILDSPFLSTVAMGEEVFPFLPVRWIVRYRYDNRAKIGGLESPLLVLHSPADDIIPYGMGKELFASAPEPKRFVETSGDHNEGFLDSPNWGPSMADFLAGEFAR
jgi:pimeloyl-ACP methyl ester carboxylesterase